MSWPFLKFSRLGKQQNYSMMMFRSIDNKQWDFYSWVYELLWIENPGLGPAGGGSKPNVSRIEAGEYELFERDDDSDNTQKGWRLQLVDKGHREAIQIHRASPNLGTKGCILPVQARLDYSGQGAPKLGDAEVQRASIIKIEQMRSRLNVLKKTNGVVGKITLNEQNKPTVFISD